MDKSSLWTEMWKAAKHAETEFDEFLLWKAANHSEPTTEEEDFISWKKIKLNVPWGTDPVVESQLVIAWCIAYKNIKAKLASEEKHAVPFLNACIPAKDLASLALVCKGHPVVKSLVEHTGTQARKDLQLACDAAKKESDLAYWMQCISIWPTVSKTSQKVTMDIIMQADDFYENKRYRLKSEFYDIEDSEDEDEDDKASIIDNMTKAFKLCGKTCFEIDALLYEPYKPEHDNGYVISDFIDVHIAMLLATHGYHVRLWENSRATLSEVPFIDGKFSDAEKSQGLYIQPYTLIPVANCPISYRTKTFERFPK